MTPETWTAIATVVIALFTIVLAISGGIQAYLTRQAINLGRKEFNATHRPKIIVRGFQIGDRDIPIGKPINFIFIAQNIGDSAAKIIEVRSGTFIQREKARIPADISFPFHESFDVDLASGTRELFPGNGGSAPKGNESTQVFSGDDALYCMGTVIYVDTGGTRRETGFCRRYRPREDRWDTIESEYEYAY